MADPKELPQQVSDLIELIKRYLLQETVDPLRRLGRSVAMAFIVALLVTLGGVLLAMGWHRYLIDALPDGQWWGAGAAAGVAVVFCLAAVIVARRMRTGGE